MRQLYSNDTQKAQTYIVITFFRNFISEISEFFFFYRRLMFEQINQIKSMNELQRLTSLKKNIYIIDLCNCVSTSQINDPFFLLFFHF